MQTNFFAFVPFSPASLFVFPVLDCDPHLNDIKELIYELNRTNGLFIFVRIMRQKFQEAALQGKNLLSYAMLTMPNL